MVISFPKILQLFGVTTASGCIMNSVNEEDFSNADTWLSEQFFNQLKEFNNEFRERLANNEFIMGDVMQSYPNPDVGPEYPICSQAIDIAASRLDSLDATFNRNLSTDTYNDIKSELLDLSYRPTEPNPLPFEAVGHVAIDGTSQTLNLSTTTSVQLVPIIPIVSGSEAFVSPPLIENQPNFVSSIDFAEEELKLLKFLEEQPKNVFVGKNGSEIYNNDINYKNINVGAQILVSPEVAPLVTSSAIVKCINCSNLIDANIFQAHVCNSDVSAVKVFNPPDLTLIPDESPPPTNKASTEPDPVLPLNPACIRLLKENQIRIRRFLKDELKYDVNALSNNNSNTKMSSTSDCADSTTGSNSDISYTTSTVAVTNSSAGKKQEGPHECTLCDRKFVHASGLLRHMEKHALDLIPTTNSSTISAKSTLPQNNSYHNVNGLRVVIKCTLCGRIFFEQNSAFFHLRSHFPKTDHDEQEMDNCAEMPYETYVDDALHFLQGELNASSYVNNNIVSHSQDYKAPLYLKMVILSCILQCEFCDYVFSDVSYLFVHSSCHLPDRRFECFSCGIHAKSSKEICTHWQAECVFMRENMKIHQAITQRYFVCNVCENKFQSLDLLHEHRYSSYHFFPRFNKRFGSLQLPCEYCEFLFDNAHDCVSHYEDKHYRKYKRGEKEGTGLSSKTRQYLCDICGKSYTQSSHLWQHLRFHQGVKPFACKEPGCTRKFTIRPDLNDHIRKCHTGERPYHCLICGKRFLTGSVFYQHRLIHRGERRYECEECGKRFYRADALKNHQRIHTGEKPFGCLFCTKNFRQRGDRDKHIRARHSHLDANARIMMQMQKLQLEAAAAAAGQHHQEPNLTNESITSNLTSVESFVPLVSSTKNKENIDPSSLVFGDDQPSSSGYGGNVSFSNDINNDIVMIGNVAFPKTMIESLMLDMDEETALKAMQLNTMNLS